MTTPSLVYLVIHVNLYPAEQFGPYSDLAYCNKVRDAVHALIKDKLVLFKDYFLKLECR